MDRDKPGINEFAFTRPSGAAPTCLEKLPVVFPVHNTTAQILRFFAKSSRRQSHEPLRLLCNLRETFVNPGVFLALAAFLKVGGLLVFAVWCLVFPWRLEVGAWCFHPGGCGFLYVGHPRQV